MEYMDLTAVDDDLNGHIQE